MKIAVALIMVLGLTVWDGTAQSLAELARLEQERRDRGPRSEETITTDMLAAARPGARLSVAGFKTPPETAADDPSVPSAQERGIGEPAATTPEQDTNPVTSGNDEELEWRARFAEAREDIVRLENLLALGELELTELTNILLTRDDLYNREAQVNPMIVLKREQIEGSQVALDAANEALTQLRTELRSAGLPAGWAR